VTARTVRTSPTSRPNVLGGLGAAVWLVIVGLPLYYLLASSLRPRSEYLGAGALAPPGTTLENYGTVLASGFVRYLFNNVVVTVAAVVIVLALAAPAGYAIVRSRSGFVRSAFSVMLMGLAIPAQATIVPVYLLITRLHLYDSLPAIILPTAAFVLPMAILVLTSVMRDIPAELYESMSLDGAGPVRVMKDLVLPLSRPGLVTVGIYTALNAWNGFIFPLVLTQDPSVRTLTLGLWDFQGAQGTQDVPAILAAVTLSMLPLLAVYLFGRRHLLSGLTAGFGR
jgi:ABC-type glycerol-3-phosphate transport system permease component